MVPDGQAVFVTRGHVVGTRHECRGGPCADEQVIEIQRIPLIGSQCLPALWSLSRVTYENQGS